MNVVAVSWTAVHSILVFALVAAMAAVTGTRLVPLPWAWYACLLLLTISAAIIGHGITGFWRGILVDENSRISLSRFQLVLWTLLLISAILTAALSNLFRGLPVLEPCKNKGPLDIAIPREVWALMGITLTSAAAAVLINATNRLRKRNASRASADGASWADLFTETTGAGDRVDVTRVQNFYFTIVLVLAYGALLHQIFAPSVFICAFPILTSGMLTLLGISHAGYLVAKAVPR